MFVLDAEKRRAHQVPVTVAGIEGSEVAIREGLEDHQEVITDGAAYLREAGEIQIVQDE